MWNNFGPGLNHFLYILDQFDSGNSGEVTTLGQQGFGRSRTTMLKMNKRASNEMGNKRMWRRTAVEPISQLRSRVSFHTLWKLGFNGL